jgi:hypothetical protein
VPFIDHESVVHPHPHAVISQRRDRVIARQVRGALGRPADGPIILVDAAAGGCRAPVKVERGIIARTRILLT